MRDKIKITKKGVNYTFKMETRFRAPLNDIRRNVKSVEPEIRNKPSNKRIAFSNKAVRSARVAV